MDVRLTGALAVAALAGCGGGAPHRPASPPDQARAAVQRYVDALAAKDPKAACAAMSVESQRASGGTGKACETNVEEAIAVNQTSFEGAKATRATVTGDHAVVQVHLATGGITHLPAVRVRGEWKYQATAL